MDDVDKYQAWRKAYEARKDAETVDDFDLRGIDFYQIKVRYVISDRIDTIVFAVDPKETNVQPIGGYIRSQHFYMHSKRDYRDTPLLEQVTKLDHLSTCINLNPPYELEWQDCDCLERKFAMCEKGSLNARRSKEARERLFDKENI